MTDYTNWSTVEEAWGQPVSDVAPTVDLLIGWASAMIRSKVPGVDRRITAGLLDPVLAQMVATNMVVRVLRNPQAIRQESVGGESVTYDTTIAAGLLDITPAELALLAGTPTSGRYGSIRLTSGLW